jgi:hypothetical protein
MNDISMISTLGTTSTDVSGGTTGGEGTTTGVTGTGTGAPGTTTGGEGTTTGVSGPATGGEDTTTSGEDATSGAPGTTTMTFCQEMEYINTLIETDSVRSTPTDVLNKQDFITKGVDFTDEKPTIIIVIPSGGAVVRDVKVPSTNVIEIQVIFITVSGRETAAVLGSPTSLPTNEFPTQKVREIIIKVIKTSNDSAPQDVTLSVIACAEGTTSGASEGKD